MKAGWEVMTIGDVCTRLHQGLNTAGEKIKFHDSGYPIIQTRNIENGVVELDNKIKLMSETDWLFYKDKYKPEIGDVFFTNIGTIGKTAIITEERDYLIHWNIFKLKPNSEKITSAFLRYVLENLTLTGYFYNLQKGGTVDFVTKKMISEAQIPLPPTNEQQRIVAILDQAFGGIAKARANAEQNLQNARALFESHLQSVFTQRGEGWEIKTFDGVLEIKNGKDQKTVEKAGGKYPIYGSAGNVMGWTDSYICDEQTTIIGRKGTINRPIFIETKFWNVDTAFGLAAKPNLNSKFLYFFCLSYDFSLHNRGTTIPSLVKTDLLTIKISVPSLAEQELFVEKFSDLHKETQRLEALYQRKIACLDELKKSLLQQAFAGEL